MIIEIAEGKVKIDGEGVISLYKDGNLLIGNRRV